MLELNRRYSSSSSMPCYPHKFGRLLHLEAQKKDSIPPVSGASHKILPRKRSSGWSLPDNRRKAGSAENMVEQSCKMFCKSKLFGPPLLPKVVPTQPRKTKIKNFTVAGVGDWRADRDERLENEFRVLQKISSTIVDRAFCVG